METLDRVDDEVETEETDGSGDAGRRDWGTISDRVAFWGFVAWCAFGWFKLIFDFGQERWFHRDDWIFLTDWTAGDAFEPFGEHLTALPLLVFRGMFNVFGLRFTPYLVVLVTMHVGVVVLLRVIMRDAGVRPWLATVGAGSFLLFGAGEQNMQWVFQIGMVGAVLFGLLQLLLASHDGPIGRRDWLALGSGLLAVLSTGVGPIMVIAVGIATFLRRGWKPAALQTVPIGAAWLVWYSLGDPRASMFGEPPTIQIVRWVREGVIGSIDAIGDFDEVSIALGVLVVTGLVLLATSMPFARFRVQAAASLGLLVCLPAFFAITSRERWIFGPGMTRSGRYLYLGAMFALPALALAGEAFARRWRYTTPVAMALLLAGVPGNYNRLGNTPPWGPDYFAAQRDHVLAIPFLPEAEQVPEWVRPEPNGFNGFGLTVGWLLDARDDGRVPEPDEITDYARNGALLRIGIVHSPEPMEGGACTTHAEPLDLRLVEGDRFRITTPVRVSMLQGDVAVPNGMSLHPEDGIVNPVPGSSTIEVVLPEFDVQLAPNYGATEFTICQ
jgi:hypothetical protein